MNGIEGVSLVSCRAIIWYGELDRNCLSSGTLLRIPLQFHCNIFSEAVKSVFNCKEEDSSEELELGLDSASIQSS